MNLRSEDKEKIIKFYQARLKKHGTQSAQTLDWTNQKNQKARFDALMIIGDMTGKTILDVGCGLGDLYGHIQKKYKDVKYTGIDIVPDFIEKAKIKHPTGNFVLGELESIQGTYDYVFASGSLTFNVGKGQDFYFDLIKKMYSKTKIAVGFNMLDDFWYNADEEYLTYNPKKVYDFCLTFAKDVRFVTDYMKGDFTFLLYKEVQPKN